MPFATNNFETNVRICLCGCGHWGKNLARNFARLGHLYAICDSDPARLESIASLYPHVKTYGSLEDVLSDNEVNAVALATPAEEHYWMTLAALRAGKDVFVEKPLALDRQDGMEMVETADHHGRVLMVGHLLRYHPAILRIQELLASGVIGK